MTQNSKITNRPIPYQIIFYFTIFFLAGSFLAYFFPQNFHVSPLIFWLLSLTGLLITFIPTKSSIVFISLLGILLGFFNVNNYFFDLKTSKLLIGQTTEISGKISEDPSVKPDKINLNLSDLKINNHSVTGQLFVSVDKSNQNNIKRSDFITVKGEIKDGFGKYFGTMSRAKITKITRIQHTDPMLTVRDWFSAKIHQFIPAQPESDLAAGFLLGQKQALSPDFSDALKITGLTHAVVASGYNLTILVRFARRIFGKISRFSALFFASTLTFGFMLIIGDSPSMFRAGTVTALSLIAWYFGRKINPIFLIFFTATISLALKPEYINQDLGWALSFASFGGILVLAPLLQAYLYKNKEPTSLGQILIETLSAQIATLPIILLSFGTFSNVAILTNILILPLVPLTMLLTFLSGLIGIFIPAIGQFFGFITEIILTYMVNTINYYSSLSWASTEFKLGASGFVLFYLIIFCVILILKKKTSLNLNQVNVVE